MFISLKMSHVGLLSSTKSQWHIGVSDQIESLSSNGLNRKHTGTRCNQVVSFMLVLDIVYAGSGIEP